MSEGAGALQALQDLLFSPFAEFGFMRRALVAVVALSMGAAPLGCLLVLRRMSLLGDAMAHALLPGAAVGYMIAGLSVTAMGLGGFVAALAVALLAGAVTRHTHQREDASFAAFYLIALALGVLLISMRGSSVDLIHVLFGSVLAVDDAALLLVASIASLTLMLLALLYRPLVVESFDAGFLASVGGPGALSHGVLLVLTVANLVGGFQAMGTLMAVGLMMVPAIAARFWVRDLAPLALLAALIAMFSGWIGLLLSFHADLPSGPAIVLVAGVIYVLSLLFGRHDGLLRRGTSCC
ncbi:ABC transporter permease [Sphaerotilus natans subsp. natans DSM 6575]|jgi:zinc/manganese transport system permease protein|uniref:ABC transporter permease n=1 Tax=Sphaerotilus natans subsp. natans DSM 6575 TaxID=1286631 RepID=A0A059KLA1_9BURK|nr:metal ABC transporter permease [Sphaerotilus natans]KDB52241.1 ABC transporter permease [Sphaerotilus natans subsp. natans DSM 6575]SIQ76917.1 zinc/manganese transport system permease protein [Sphaerotilus natans]